MVSVGNIFYPFSNPRFKYFHTTELVVRGQEFPKEGQRLVMDNITIANLEVTPTLVLKIININSLQTFKLDFFLRPTQT